MTEISEFDIEIKIGLWVGWRIQIRFYLDSRGAISHQSRHCVYTISLGSHVLLTCKTFGNDIFSCRVAWTRALSLSRSQYSQVEAHARRLLDDCCSSPMLTVIVSRFWKAIACLLDKSSRFCWCRAWNFGNNIWGRVWCKTMLPRPPYILLPALKAHARRFLIVHLHHLWLLLVVHHCWCGYSLFVISRKYQVLGTDHFILLLSLYCHTV